MRVVITLHRGGLDRGVGRSDFAVSRLGGSLVELNLISLKSGASRLGFALNSIFSGCFLLFSVEGAGCNLFSVDTLL